MTVAREVSVSISALTMAWGRGWAVSRGTEAPVPIEGGYRIETGQPKEKVRHVFHSISAAELREFSGSLTEPGTWIKVVGPRASTIDNFAPHWTFDIPGWMMSAPLTPAEVNLPDPYAIDITSHNGARVAHIYDVDGNQAASGRCGPDGEFAVFDQIKTEPAHRRKGLGRVIMAALTNAAIDRGAATGVLGSTEDGKALYLNLGWTIHTELTGAYIPAT